MVDILRFRHQAQIDEEAAVWVWRLDSAPDDQSIRAQFDGWLVADPRHRRAYEQLAGAWQQLDRLVGAGAPPLAPAAAATRRPKAWWRWMASAAAVLLLAGAAVAIFLPERRSQTGTVATAVGLRQRVELADGSVVLLNTNSIVAYDLQRGERDLYLRKGEAHFQVAHDRSRPFLVHAGDAIVRAVGTQFDVHVLAGNHVDVLVDEGRVEVVPEPAPAATASPGAHPLARPQARTLSAGQQLSSGEAGFTVVSVTPLRADHQLAWREGAVMFDGEPLSEAVAEISRYTDARLVITDQRVAAMRFGGRFRTDDLNGFLAALQAALPINVRTDASGTVYIEPRR